LKTQYIYLVRHGETQANANDTTQGQSLNQNLNKEGIKQVERLGKYLKVVRNHYPLPEKIYTSRLLRAMQTACILKNELFGIKLLPEIISIPDLAEIDYGKIEGISITEAYKKYPRVLKSWREDPLNTKFPGGETARKARKRVASAWEKILLESESKHLLMTTHGGTISLIFSHITKARNFRAFKQDNSCLNIITISGGKPSIIKTNMTTHLDE